MLQLMKASDVEELQSYLRKRNQGIPKEVEESVRQIINTVIEEGDEGVKFYTKKFDGHDLDSFEVSKEEIDELALSISPELMKALSKARDNIVAFHKRQVRSGYEIQKDDDIYMGMRIMPLERVGVYVPGGRAAYPSTVLMNVLPAKLAGVKEIIMCTPLPKDGKLNPTVIAAAKIAGVDRIFTIGGAQAIAAMAYGTKSIPQVDKIVGPGNIYVAAAKKEVFGSVDIDMIAGPSEILVIADESANPKFVAADLLSQAEHDPLASAILLSPSVSMIEAVNEEVTKQMAILPKKEICEQSVANYGKAILCRDIDDCIAIANVIAPEHLELQIADPQAVIYKVRNAGSVFMGYYACESIGDYLGGVNHVLPTSGTARFSSGLGVESFVKRSTYLYYSEEALRKDAEDIVNLAEEEQLEAHANAVKVRM